MRERRESAGRRKEDRTAKQDIQKLTECIVRYGEQLRAAERQIVNRDRDIASLRLTIQKQKLVIEAWKKEFALKGEAS